MRMYETVRCAYTRTSLIRAKAHSLSSGNTDVTRPALPRLSANGRYDMYAPASGIQLADRKSWDLDYSYESERDKITRKKKDNIDFYINFLIEKILQELF